MSRDDSTTLVLQEDVVLQLRPLPISRAVSGFGHSGGKGKGAFGL